MKILFIAAGSGDAFYCCNCFRDNLHAQALRRHGHEVVFMPLYLPVDSYCDSNNTPTFFGAVSYYIAAKWFGKRKLPNWLNRMLNHKSILKQASSLSGTTSSIGLEDITLSMIYGDDPLFQSEARKLIDFIRADGLPDVVHLSNALLIGIARSIREELNIPVVCTLQDEHVWIDTMQSGYKEKAWEGIRRNLSYVSKLTTFSHFYRDYMTQKLKIADCIDVIYPGVHLSDYSSNVLPDSPTIGFFYRMNSLDGFDLLVEAFLKVKREGAIPNLKLLAAGGYSKSDIPFVEEMAERLSDFADDVTIDNRYHPTTHASFYKRISVLAVPVTFDEAAGLYLCEAFAAGVPAIEPATGSFPEMIENAGILYSPNSVDALADAIQRFFADDALMEQCRQNARELSANRYNDKLTTKQLIDLYHSLIE